MDFGLLIRVLVNKNVEDVKQYITPVNVHDVDEEGDEVAWYIFNYGPDDPSLVSYLVECGYHANENKMVLRAIRSNKPKILRALLDDYSVSPKNDWLETAILYHNTHIIRVLIDAGVSVTVPVTSHSWSIQYPEFINRFITKRNHTRTISVIVIGLKTLCARSDALQGNGKDVLVMIARCIWSTRGHETEKYI